jgi:nicotinamide-nucleotide amidase
VKSAFDQKLTRDAEELLRLCEARRVTIATAESCTGGLLAALLTEVPGSSKSFERGFITYSNEAKSDLLGVSGELIRRQGAVSEDVALAMAKGALARSRASIAVSITGVAGPGGGSAEKPVGLVFLACAGENREPVQSRLDLGMMSRGEIRQAAVAEAMRLLRHQAER